MPRQLRKISGTECVKILCNHFGFTIKRQNDSHIVLSKESNEVKKSTVVPNHKELKIGTLKGILELAGIEEEKFAEFQ